MTERLTDQQRRALLAGDTTEPLEPADAADLDLLAVVLADPATWAEPRPELEDSVLRAVADAPPAPTRAGAVSTKTACPRERKENRRGRGFLVAALGAAASIAIVVGVLALTGDATSPDYTANLSATGLAPDAHAGADVTRNTAGFRVELDAHGLRPLDRGAYYQAWLKNGHGGLVSIGTFSSSDGSIVLWSGVDPKEYRGITVTIEPDDDNPASSGRRVLAGRLRAT